ncbi:MAG: DNA repair protein RecO [Actinobacteria bacterium]|nr:MAG: DNA repair protein RecO [Actinomycetota bacterium]
MALYRDTGVVLRTWKLGEADRIVSVFTREHGKVRGVAKGVRKSGSRFGSRLEPTCHVSVQLYKGKGDLDTITQVELIERPESVRDDYDLWVRASAMLEAVDHMTIDREPNEVMFDMLVRALRTLAARRGPLVAPAFFLKLLALEGLEPLLDCCVGCGIAEPLVAFGFIEGGAQCPSCRTGVSLSDDALQLLRQIFGGQLGLALEAPASATTAELDTLATRLFEAHLERQLRSIALLEHH